MHARLIGRVHEFSYEGEESDPWGGRGATAATYSYGGDPVRSGRIENHIPKHTHAHARARARAQILLRVRVCVIVCMYRKFWLGRFWMLG